MQDCLIGKLPVIHIQSHEAWSIQTEIATHFYFSISVTLSI